MAVRRASFFRFYCNPISPFRRRAVLLEQSSDDLAVFDAVMGDVRDGAVVDEEVEHLELGEGKDHEGHAVGVAGVSIRPRFEHELHDLAEALDFFLLSQPRALSHHEDDRWDLFDPSHFDCQWSR